MVLETREMSEMWMLYMSGVTQFIQSREEADTIFGCDFQDFTLPVAMGKRFTNAVPYKAISIRLTGKGGAL
jgi:hypothetical protein